MEPKEFIKAIEEYLTKNEIDIDTVTADNIDCENYEQLLWGNDIFDFRFGATRGCFIPAYNPSFVFKFDFDGLWEEYCAAERDFYKEACAQGLQKCFTKIYKFDYILQIQNAKNFCRVHCLFIVPCLETRSHADRCFAMRDKNFGLIVIIIIQELVLGK